MTEQGRDDRGKFAPVDPLRAAYNEQLERNQSKLARIFGPAAEDPPADAGPGSFDQGARGSGVEGKATMDDLLREAVDTLHSGAREVTIEVNGG